MNQPRALLIVAAAAAVACGGPHHSSKTDAGESDAGGDDDAGMMDAGPADSGFPTAAHEEFSVPDQGGPTISTPTLVTITYADLQQRQYVETFGAWLVQSNWLQQAGADYGVMLGSAVTAQLIANAPTSINYLDIPTEITNAITAGIAPMPTGDDIYVIYYPSTTSIMVQGADLCSTSGGGYHDQVGYGSNQIAYAVVTDCTSNPGSTTMTNFTTGAAHEFIEASTDPLPQSNPAYFMGATSTNPWGQVGGEVADMCAYAPTLTINSYEIPPVWSNSASLAGADPCVPVLGPYFSVSVSPVNMQPVAAGASFNFTLTGWSTGTVADWMLYTDPLSPYYQYTPFVPGITLGTASGFNNGSTTMLTVSVPTGTPAGSGALVFIGSYHSDADVVGQVAGVYVP